jgi:hypothetical protein
MGQGVAGETAQTMYAHMNKWIKKRNITMKPLCIANIF